MKHNKRNATDFINNPCTETFTCKVCGWICTPEGAGSDHRNHCPNCLSSKHVDDEPGDRASDCGAVMEAIGVWVRKNGEWAIIHRCTRCGKCASVCPMGSIDKAAPTETGGICIKCQACIKACPARARRFLDGDFLSHVKMLENTLGD